MATTVLIKNNTSNTDDLALFKSARQHLTTAEGYKLAKKMNLQIANEPAILAEIGDVPTATVTVTPPPAPVRRNYDVSVSVDYVISN